MCLNCICIIQIDGFSKTELKEKREKRSFKLLANQKIAVFDDLINQNDKRRF